MYQLKPKEVDKVVKLFNKGVKNARKISEQTYLPHRSIMKALESKGLRSYSAGSYS